MSWISLAAKRYRFRELVAEKMADPDYRTSKMKVVTANDGRDALLLGEREAIEVEVRRATDLLSRRRQEKKAPPENVMSKILGLAVIASLGGDDPEFFFKAIAQSKSYKQAWEKSLQLVARRILGLESTPSAPVDQAGHITTDEEWYRLVKKAPTAQAFNLALTPDHPRWVFLGSYVLPLAFLLSQERKAKDKSADLLKLMRTGTPDPEGLGTVLYERVAEISASKKSESRLGFDAIEMKKGELRAYYYLGIRWQAPLLFQDDLNTYDFLDHLEADWKTVKQAVSEELWSKIEKARAENNCTYVVVYDGNNAFAPEEALQRAAAHYQLNIETHDLTEI